MVQSSRDNCINFCWVFTMVDTVKGKEISFYLMAAVPGSKLYTELVFYWVWWICGWRSQHYKHSTWSHCQYNEYTRYVPDYLLHSPSLPVAATVVTHIGSDRGHPLSEFIHTSEVSNGTREEITNSYRLYSTTGWPGPVDWSAVSVSWWWKEWRY